MAFSFPDPTLTPEFTGANGITYEWDPTDEKWVVKGFSTEEDPRYVKRQGGDSMEGPLVMEGPRNAGDDPLLPAKVSSIKTLNVDNTQNSGLQLRHNGNAKVYVGDSDVSFAADIKFNRNAPTVIKNNTQDLLSFDGSEVAYLGEIIEDEDIVNKKFVEDITDQLHQDVISLDEEIESIAKSMEKGFWHYEQAADTHRTPREGHFYLLKNYTPDTGGLGAAFTEEYSEAEAVVFNNKEWNPDSADGSGGGNHTWADVEVGELIDLLDKPDPDYLFGKITHVDKNYHSAGVIIAFDKIEFDGSPTNHDSGLHETLLKIFKEPTGGTATEFVKKTGDKMSGTLTMGDTLQMPDGSNTHSPEIVFKAKNSSGTTRTNTLQVKADANTLYASGSFRSGGSLSTASSVQYQGGDRIKLGISSAMQDLRVGNNLALQWDSTYGIRGIRAANSWGSNGKFLAYSSSYGLIWETPPSNTISDYVKDGTNRSGSPITITKSGGVYYITGG